MACKRSRVQIPSAPPTHTDWRTLPPKSTSPDSERPTGLSSGMGDGVANHGTAGTNLDALDECAQAERDCSANVCVGYGVVGDLLEFRPALLPL